MLRALVVDDDVTFQEAIAELVREEGFEVATAATLAEARVGLAASPPDVVLLDINLPDGSGLDLLRQADGPVAPEFVLVTGNGTVDSAIDAMRHGASDYLTKPADVPRLRSVLLNVARRGELRSEIGALRGKLRTLGRFGALIGASPPMQATYDLIARVAPTEASVLITGESGTGKELAAETIHRLSRRKDAPFVALNCGAVTPTLLESELFGHERGSFTGAARTHKGYFERANGGTLFLDEITEMPIESQVRLLRVLEASTLVRVGGEEDVTVDLRVIAATNRAPEAAVAEGKLREDLLYRLGVFPIAMPPLRERGDDVVLLAEAFLDELNHAEKTIKRFQRQALVRLRDHGWPGNVRELRNAIQRAFILADEDIEASHLPIPQAGAPEQGRGASFQVTIGTSIAQVERRMILATLAALDGDKERAAATLGISLKTLYNKLKKYRREL
ncbi:MAG TPA: sigma-54 dependent transcriptional regulator [Candidatus Eisenbacteria bacterium]|nr:sigma-54 dependent transcriptional regulator [Candidatus Eisenbacteria bacterium]